MNTQHVKQLEEALKAEKLELETLYRSQLELSPNEQRKTGIALFPLTIVSQEEAGNNTLVSFRTSFPINETYFRRGCQIRCTQGNWYANGRLLELDTTSGVFALTDEDIPSLREEPVTLHFLPDDRTMACMELGVRLLETHPQLQIFESAIKTTHELSEISIPESVTGKLNPSQQLAAACVLGSEPLVLIQGPPGTGKTLTLAIAIAQWVKSGKRVIISAPSNTAVDNLCHGLLDQGIPLLRLGNEEKMSNRVTPFTIDGYLEKGSTRQLFDHLRQSLRKAEAVAEKYYRNPSQEAIRERSEARKERTNLRKEIRQLLRDEEIRLINETPVLAGTPVGLFNALPKTFVSDLVVLDEAGQCTEPLAWLVASFGKRFVVCGDQQQLPPVVVSRKAQSLGLSKSILEREGAQAVLLNEQYRMTPVVMDSINGYFYENKLLAHPSVPAQGEIRFVDMAGYGEGEQQDEYSGSSYSETEADAVVRIIAQLNIQPEHTVILSPYNAQLELLKKRLPGFRISTIDSMQGQEAETIIISLTRSNENSDIGFLKDYRRTNVAISRAKKQCILVGDSATIGHDSFYNALLGYIEQKGLYQSIWEYEQ